MFKSDGDDKPARSCLLIPFCENQIITKASMEVFLNGLMFWQIALDSYPFCGHVRGMSRNNIYTVAISTYQIEAWQTLRLRRSGHHGFFGHPIWLVHIRHHDVIPLRDCTFLNGRLNFTLQILQEISVYSCGCPWVQLNKNSNIPSLQLQLQFPIFNKW
jgi:hypothetical protein